MRHKASSQVPSPRAPAIPSITLVTILILPIITLIPWLTNILPVEVRGGNQAHPKVRTQLETHPTDKAAPSNSRQSMTLTACCPTETHIHNKKKDPGSRCGNDPSAGSPTETLLRLHLPLNDEVYSTSQRYASVRTRATDPKISPNHSIGRCDGRCVQRAGT